MPKLTQAGTTMKISIYEILKTGNVRADYTDIEELAASIKKNTLLEPILVKIAEPVDGDPRYELIAGHRRVMAHEWLCKHGDDFSMIEAKIVTGNKLTIQLVENLQRADLSAKDREKAIFQMSKVPGVTQRDIASELSKTEVYVSRQISAYKVRTIAEEAGIDTSTLETSVMSEIQTVPKEDVSRLVQHIIDGGGTVAAAKVVMQKYRFPWRADPEIIEQTIPSTEEPSPSMTTQEQAHPAPPETDIDPLKDNVETPGNKGKGAEIKADNPEAWKRGEIKHKQVNLNDVFNEIYMYLTALEKKIHELGPGKTDVEMHKMEAALDIISLVQKRFEN